VTDPRAEYHRRLDAWNGRIERLDRAHLLVSNARLACAAACAVLLWLAFVRASLSPAWVLLPGLAFGALVVVHVRLLQQRDRARRAHRLYESGIARLDDRWAGGGRDGARFLHGHHFARDVDLFGRGSLFELINTARTEAGEVALADWFRAGADLDEVRARQAAVAELVPMIDFREDLSVLAAEAEVSRTGALAAWAASAGAGFSRTAPMVLAACAIITVVLSVLAYEDFVGAPVVVAWLFVQTAIAAVWRRQVHRVIGAVATPERDLALLSGVLERIERQQFASPRLASLESTLTAGGRPPSRRIADLRRLVSWIDASRNQLFAPFAAALLLRSQLAAAVDRWHAHWGASVSDWLRVVGELEAFASLAAYAYEHPADPFPVLVDDDVVFQAEALAHPLIPAADAVANDVHLGGVRLGVANPHVIIVSGSNMSGKSTLLRTVGVNVVLALSGAPVRARHVRLSRLAIGATLKVEDSLQEGHSRFYAEILRIKTIVDVARGPVPLLFLLDEILHGTNSFDRRIGAEAIVRALVGEGAIGLVTTHDLALTESVGTIGAAVPSSGVLPGGPPGPGFGATNMHFEDRLVDGRMVFDYRMHPGVVEHSNALALMRAIGLDV
jgi:hypothetical protein